MKVKVGYNTGYKEVVVAYVDLDSQDIIDMNFKNATSKTIYFFNLKNRLSFIGEMKVISAWNEFDPECDYHFVNIVSDEELTKKQIAYNNHKKFANMIINEMKKPFDERQLIKETKKVYNNVLDKIDNTCKEYDVYNNVNKAKDYTVDNIKKVYDNFNNNFINKVKKAVKDSNALNTNITDKILEHNGWIYETDSIINSCYDNYFEMHYRYKEYHIIMKNNVWGFSDKLWFCYVDNIDCDTIGNISINTIKQFNKFMEALGIDYKLSNV